jgi:hypothetical protein
MSKNTPENNADNGESNWDSTYPHLSTIPPSAARASLPAVPAWKMAVARFLDRCLHKVFGRFYPASPAPLSPEAQAQLDALDGAIFKNTDLCLLIENLDERTGSMWPPARSTPSGRYLIDVLRPGLVETVTTLTETRARLLAGQPQPHSAKCEEAALALIRPVYRVLDETDAEVNEGRFF